MNYPVPQPEIFKAYDIRGIVDRSLTAEAVRAIGHALGSEAKARNQATIAVGRDGRLSGPALAGALAEGICAAGVNVIDIGMVPTPVTYFAAQALGVHSCVSVTGSHNPPDYNGLKMVLGGHTLFGAQITDLRRRIADNDLTNGQGTLSHADVDSQYIERIVSDIKLARPMKIVIDCGNGVAGHIAPKLFRALGCEVTELFCEVDGHFPNHHPDPSRPENLQDVIRALTDTDAEIGLAFDGDGDRLGVVTKDGEIIYPDRQLILFARDVLSRSRRRALDVEHRPRTDQSQTQRNRRPASRRDERPHLLQRTLVRLRRRPLQRRPPARNPLTQPRRQRPPQSPAQRSEHA